MPVFLYTLDSPFPADCRGGAASIGNFDGVHRGHQALIKQTIRHARAVGGPAVAVTFDPPPAQILRPENCQPLLSPLGYRCELLHDHGIDHVIVLQTSQQLLRLDATDFFARILNQGLHAKAVVEGFNFAFGRGRVGTGTMLQELGDHANMKVTLLDAQMYADQPISSSRVRNDLLGGQTSLARDLLGRPYRLFGTVGLGKQRGRTLGFPTANLNTLMNLAPGPGVYACRVLHDRKTWTAAAHLGPKPTFHDQTPSVEIHLLGFQGDLYGQTLAVDFFEKVREPRPFANPDELVRQIKIDIERVTAIMAAALV